MEHKRMKFFVQPLKKIDDLGVVTVIIVLRGYEIAWGTKVGQLRAEIPAENIHWYSHIISATRLGDFYGSDMWDAWLG